MEVEPELSPALLPYAAGLTRLLGYLLVSGGPREQLANVRWPMHKALHELFDETGRTGQRDLLGVDLELRPSRGGGLAVAGADRALDQLVRSSVLHGQGRLREARLCLDDGAAIGLRRELMTIAPEQVRLYKRTGMRWSALAAVAARNRSMVRPTS